MTTGNLTQKIYQKLRSDIRNGTLEPNAPLRMDTLRVGYGIGTTPLREALSRLSAENLVSVKVGSGFRVASISLKEFEELIALREDLEHKALVASIANGDDAWEAKIVSCYHSLSKLSWYDIRGDRQALEEREARHRTFHLSLIEACNSTWLLRLWDQLTAHEERYRRIATQDIEISKAYSDKIEAEHALLRDAALRRDSKGTWAILQPHRRLNVRAVRKMFEQEA